MNEKQTIGAILRDCKQKSRATVPDLFPELIEYAQYLKAMRREDAGGWDTRGEPEMIRQYNRK